MTDVGPPLWGFAVFFDVTQGYSPWADIGLPRCGGRSSANGTLRSHKGTALCQPRPTAWVKVPRRTIKPQRGDPTVTERSHLAPREVSSNPLTTCGQCD